MQHDKVWVTIKNFKKYKGRSDVKSNSWFRCSNRILEDQDFYDFTHSEICVWIYVLCLVSEQNSATICLNIKRAENVARLQKDVILGALKKLKDIEVITAYGTRPIRERNVDDTQEIRARNATYSTDKTDSTEQTVDTAAAEKIPSNSDEVLGLKVLKKMCEEQEERGDKFINKMLSLDPTSTGTIRISKPKSAADSHTVGDSSAKPAAPQPQASTKSFPVIDELKGSLLLEDVLRNITDSAQRSWVARYPKEWLRSTLLDAVEYHVANEGVAKPSEISDWGKRLHGWLRREKKPSLVNPGAPDKDTRDWTDLDPDELERLFPEFVEESRP